MGARGRAQTRNTHVVLAPTEAGVDLDKNDVVGMLSDGLMLPMAVSEGPTDRTKAA